MPSTPIAPIPPRLHLSTESLLGNDGGDSAPIEASPLEKPPTQQRFVGRSPFWIYRTALALHQLLIAAFDLAGPRLRALNVAAGPWREHNYTSSTWSAAEALILAEAMTEILARDPLQTIHGRPNYPFSGHNEKHDSFCVSYTLPPEDRLLNCGFNLYLEFNSAARTCHAKPGHIHLAAYCYGYANTNARARDTRWHAELKAVLAHELAHIWQFNHWKKRDLTTSAGGPGTHYSPHAARPWEIYAHACDHAIYLVTRELTPEENLNEFTDPAGPWHQYWFAWRDPEFVAAHPGAASAAYRYHRLLRIVYPIFQAEWRSRTAKASPDTATPCKELKDRQPAITRLFEYACSLAGGRQ